MNATWRRRLAAVGLLLLVLSPAFFWKTCEDLGGEPTEDGVEIVGFTGFTVTYAIDEVRTCTVGMGPVFLVVGAGTLGYLLLGDPPDD